MREVPSQPQPNTHVADMTHPNPDLPELETAGKPVAAIEALTSISLAIAVLSLLLFAWLANDVARDRILDFDLLVRGRIHAYASPWLTSVMIGVSFLGAGGLVIAASVAILAFIFLQWWRAALWLGITILGAVTLEVTLKYAFDRARPPAFFVPPPHTPSFPSGHALVSFCCYAVLAGLLADRIRSPQIRVLLWTLAAILVAAIGFSRIYLGVHYPSDVLAGYLAATLWVSTMITVDRLRARRNSRAGTQEGIT